MELFRYVLLNKYVSSQIRQVVAYVLDRFFDLVITFNNKKDRILFLSGNYGIFNTNEQLINTIKAPYCLVYNEFINESYMQQFNANFLAYGFKKDLITINKLAPNNYSPTNTTIEDFKLSVRHNRIFYTANLSLVASSYDELLDITSSFTSLIVINRFFGFKIPLTIYIPNTIQLYNQDTRDFFEYTLSKNLIEYKNLKLVDKNMLAVTDEVAVYARLENISQNNIALFDSTNMVYKADATITIEMPIVKQIELYGYIPVRGVHLQLKLENDIDFNLITEDTKKIERYVKEIDILQDSNGMVLDLEHNLNKIDRNSIRVLYTKQKDIEGNILYDLLSIFLPYEIDEINNQLIINYNLKANSKLKIAYNYEVS